MIELNLDAGEKQLLALYRALIESSRRIVVLARRCYYAASMRLLYSTVIGKRSNVDVEMDAQFWKLFSLLEVSSSTLLCITEHIDTICRCCSTEQYKATSILQNRSRDKCRDVRWIGQTFQLVQYGRLHFPLAVQRGWAVPTDYCAYQYPWRHRGITTPI